MFVGITCCVETCSKSSTTLVWPKYDAKCSAVHPRFAFDVPLQLMFISSFSLFCFSNSDFSWTSSPCRALKHHNSHIIWQECQSQIYLTQIWITHRHTKTVTPYRIICRATGLSNNINFQSHQPASWCDYALWNKQHQSSTQSDVIHSYKILIRFIATTQQRWI